MALDQSVANPGTFDAPDADWPIGKPRNVSGPGNQDGAPWNLNVFGDIYGFFTSIFEWGSEVPNGSNDNANNTQILDTLNKCMPEVSSLKILKHIPDNAGDKIDDLAFHAPNFLGRAIKIRQIRVDADSFGDFNIRDANGDLIAEVEAATVGSSPDMQTVAIIKDDPVGKLYVQEIGLNASNYTKFSLYVTYTIEFA